MSSEFKFKQIIKVIIGAGFVGLLAIVSLSCKNNKEASVSSRQESLFNGSDLTGWSGDTAVWKAEDNMIVGSTMEYLIDHAVWLTTNKNYGNFELTMSVKLVGDANKNSGVYYRGKWNNDVVVGYEFDIGGWGAEEGEPAENWWGELHDPYRRGDLWVGPGREIIDSTYKEAEWNNIKIRADGSHIQHWLNGTKMVDWYEQDTTIQKSGFIGFQLHDESRCKVYFRNIKLLRLSD
jgi:hypothetical protein